MLNANLTCGKPYFSFFNCGAKSGASQPHKHVQFLPTLQGFGGPPIERVARGIKLANECASFVPVTFIHPLFRLPITHYQAADLPSVCSFSAKPFTLTSVPFTAHVRRLNRQVTGSIPSTPEGLERLRGELASAFMSLLDEMYHKFRLKAQQEESEHHPDGHQKTSESPSYNVILTLEHMYIVPRAKEEFVADGGPGETELKLSVNSLGFAGMLLVKSEYELERVREVTIRRILGEVGMKPLVGVEERDCDDVFLDDIH
jgi:ATP adenylyltransferase